jgi:glycosyltransferase involved in cell wall biosynthesis
MNNPLPQSYNNLAEPIGDRTPHQGHSVVRPDVTVVIPCFNQAHFLTEAIDSALNQDGVTLEVIVVDDGSPDGTYDVAAKYPSVVYVRQSNKGLAGARNTGLALSRGQYVVFLDADDRLLPNAVLTNLRHSLAHTECAFVAGHYEYLSADARGTTAVRHHGITTNYYLELLKDNFIGMIATVMFRRDILLCLRGFDPTARVCEDYDLYLRAACKWPVFCHNELVAAYRRHEACVSTRAALMLSGSLEILKRHRRTAHSLGSEYASAYRSGRRKWRNRYGRDLLRLNQRNFKSGLWREALTGTWTLLPHVLPAAVSLIARAGSRTQQRK